MALAADDIGSTRYSQRTATVVLEDSGGLLEGDRVVGTAITPGATIYLDIDKRSGDADGVFEGLGLRDGDSAGVGWVLAGMVVPMSMARRRVRAAWRCIVLVLKQFVCIVIQCYKVSQ